VSDKQAQYDAVNVSDAPQGADGVTVSIKADGEVMNLTIPFDLLAEIIRKVRRHEADKTPSGNSPLGHPSTVQTLVAAGQAQPVGSVECALVIETVELGRTVLQAGRAQLVSLREQIDKTLALQGGHGTVQ
jgi:hypothetical protein